MTEGDSGEIPSQPNTSPHQEGLAVIWMSERPFDTLAQVSQQVPGRLGYQTALTLRRTMAEIPEQRDRALAELVWLCLPQLNLLLQRLRGLGLGDQELVKEGLLNLYDYITTWEPKDNTTSTYDHLRAQTTHNLEWRLGCLGNRPLRLACQ